MIYLQTDRDRQTDRTNHFNSNYPDLYQFICIPQGYAYNAYPDNYREIEDLAIASADALYQVHGTVFDPINSADLCKIKMFIF